jgi:hypothetical protein
MIKKRLELRDLEEVAKYMKKSEEEKNIKIRIKNYWPEYGNKNA